MKTTISITPGDLSVSEFHGHLLSAVVPRPIGFVSTIDSLGQVNLSPFSFFNCFGANPPILVFSPARRVRDNSIKHTLENLQEVPEVVIGIVNYAMVEQMSLSSTEYEKGVNEFIKAGLTEVPSERVTPPRVGECPISFECKVNEVIALGNKGGAGNLVVCEILKMHIHREVLGENGKVDPGKLDAVARLGGNNYSRIGPESIFEVEKPVREKGVGIDKIPDFAKNSGLLSGNDLGKLGNIPEIPATCTMNEEDFQRIRVEIREQGELCKYEWVKKFLNERNVTAAWDILLFA